mmetsp:Transcript_72188/g.203719  ORF Transcript_72188/g.203719 Transcript_72188/m.203719 type:complete len:299 (+) Transcript_72188:798-1694(+)
MPMSITGKRRLMYGTKSIFIACGIASRSSKNPRRTLAFSSEAPISISGTSSPWRVLSILRNTSAIAKEAPNCSAISPSRNFLKSHGWLNCREYSGKTCSMVPKAFAASLTTSATGSVKACCIKGMMLFKYGFMLSTSCTSIDVDPKICADHFLLVESRSFSPRTTTGISRESDAGSIKERKVWLPILASTACVCFWFVGSARAVTNSWESFLISGLATKAPISRSTAAVAFRISARTSRAASASLGTIRGKTEANCAGVFSPICRKQGDKTSMQQALVFHVFESMPASKAGTTMAATP